MTFLQVAIQTKVAVAILEALMNEKRPLSFTTWGGTKRIDLGSFARIRYAAPANVRVTGYSYKTRISGGSLSSSLLISDITC